MKKLILSALTLLLFQLNGQEIIRCGTGELPQQFEQWLQGLPSPTATTGKYSSAQVQSVFNIPVIVHIIHNNEALNGPSSTSGGNLHANQVIDQINILNKDFNGLNADTNLIPSVFKPLLGKFQVNFCLAVVNPTGGILAEPGIDRISRTSKGWNAPPYSTTYMNNTIKPASIWDPNKYLNIWVASLSGGILGYATFPAPGTSGLSGLTGSFGTATTDGVVILNTAFGSIGTAAFGQYNKGRTATHEVGHWIGLRHIWGDGTCATDYCNDTPPAQTANYGCKSHPYKLGVCAGNTTGEMFMNFMDYSDDACLLMFTADQKNRAQLILTHSPIRAALITSTVCNLPNIGNDVGITYVASPTYSQVISCNNYINPVVHVTNYGSTVLSSAVFSFNINGVNTQTMVWTGSVNPGSSFTVALPQITNLANGAQVLNVSVSSPNGGVDNNLSNNNDQQIFSIVNVFNPSVNSVTTCIGNPVVLNATTPGATSYVWSNGLGNTASVSVNPPGNSVYTVNISNGLCVAAKQVTVSVINGATISVNNATICSGNSVVLNASGAASYTWNGSTQGSSLSVSPQTTSTYTVLGNIGGGCAGSKTATVTVNPSPTLTALSYTVCSGGTTTLSVSGANTYSWSTGNTANTFTVSPLSNQTYTVTGFIGNCSASKTVSASVGAALSVYITPSSPTICAGSPVHLQASGALSYTWNNNSNADQQVLNPGVTTTYSLVGQSGTCTGTTVLTVTVNSVPVLSLTPLHVTCFGSSNGQINASATGNGPFNYSYSGPNNSPQNLAPGVYSVIVSDANGCASSNTVTITQPASLTSTVTTMETSCPLSCDGVANFSAEGGVSPYTQTISKTGGSVVSNSILCPGNYTSTVTDANGCTVIKPFTVSSGNTGLGISVGYSNVNCSGCHNATVFVNILTGTAPFTYTWSPDNTFTATLDSVPEGCYWVTVKDAAGCVASANQCVLFDVGINENLKENGVKVWPNPAKDIVTLEFKDAQTRQLTIYDVWGRIVKHKELNSSLSELNLGDMAAGVYVLRVESSGQAGVIKLIKE